jgi:predicted 3-demethylubiquinone-9 3-methyltransferase (glyoxalase superfamily)
MFVGDVCGKAEEAIAFYISVFKQRARWSEAEETKADVLARYGKGEEPGQEGDCAVRALLASRPGVRRTDSAREHRFAFTEAISFIVPCDTQKEID